MITKTTLLSDQVFQLNTFLWALESLSPSERGPIRPVLREAGYYLVAIGRKVLVPSSNSVIDALQGLTGTPDRSSCRPDLWLKHSEHPVQTIVELKGRSFSAESSKRKQAIKLLLSAFDLSASLGEPSEAKIRGHLVYGTISKDAVEMATTLKQLAAKTSAEGVPSAPSAVIGLSIEDEGVVLSSPTPSDLPGPAERRLANRALVLRQDGDNDFRPLYLVPWIPGIEDSQNSELRQDGLQELTARLLTYTQSRVGRARVPTTVSLSGDELLRDATFGIFDQWQDDNRDKFSRSAVNIVEKALNSDVSVQRHGKRLDIDLASEEHQETAIKCLKETDPADPATNLANVFYDQPPLFD